VRSAALLVALFTIVVGLVGIVSPDSVTTVRRQYFATPVRLYAAGAVRVAMGLVLILVAPTSRAPRTMRALGAVVCMQGVAATVLGPDRARAILEWESMQGTALLRVGAAVALVSGGFIAFAVTGHRPKSGAK
jgi:drug/metabolite transporter superfamily protein YnfA